MSRLPSTMPWSMTVKLPYAVLSDRHDHPAVVGRADDRAAGEVGAGVQLRVVQDRVEPHAERRGDRAVERVREGAGALHGVAALGQLLGQALDLRAELARLGDPGLVEGDVAAARGLHRRSGRWSAARRGRRPGRWRRPAPSSPRRSGRRSARSRALTSGAADDQVAEPLVGAGRAVLDHPPLAGAWCRGRGRRTAGATRSRPARRRPRRSPSPGRAARSSSASCFSRAITCFCRAISAMPWSAARNDWLARVELGAGLVVDQVLGGLGAGDHRGGVGLALGGLLARGRGVVAVAGPGCRAGAAAGADGSSRPTRRPSRRPSRRRRRRRHRRAPTRWGAGRRARSAWGAAPTGPRRWGRDGDRHARERHGRERDAEVGLGAARRTGDGGGCHGDRREQQARARYGADACSLLCHGDTVTNERAAAQVTLSACAAAVGPRGDQGSAVGSLAFSRNGAGSSGSPSMRTSKCRCGPVA